MGYTTLINRIVEIAWKRWEPTPFLKELQKSRLRTGESAEADSQDSSDLRTGAGQGSSKRKHRETARIA